MKTPSKVMWLLLFQVIFYVAALPDDDELIVKTKSGMVKGVLTRSRSGKPIKSFLNIPYAEAPLKELRFKYPQPIKPWSDVLNATSLPFSCPQRTVSLARFHPHLKKQTPTTASNEDCLKLNLWVPVTRNDSSKPLPVLIYIHGGGFSFGSSTTSTNLGDSLAAEEEVIVCSMNFRLASLGFAFFNHTEAPGNVGLYDQKMAIEWLLENVEAFGGDPENATLIGESAGGTSVLIHALHEDNSRLFPRIILLSPALKTGVFADKQEMYKKSLELAVNIGCPVNDTLEAIQCLRDADANEILLSEPSEKGYSFLNFFPFADGNLVKELPHKLIAKGLGKKDVLIGNSKDEATIFMILIDPFVFSITSQKVKPRHEAIRSFFTQFVKGVPNLAMNMVDFQYTNWIDLDNPDKIFGALKHLINDYVFNCHTTTIADSYAKVGGRVYRYYSTHYPPSSYAPKWFGAYHGSQNIYVFGDLYDHPTPLPDSEFAFSERLMRYVANFARTGNPNEATQGQIEKIQWPRYTLTEKNYLVWAPNSTATGFNLRQKQCVFWRDLMPHIANITGFELP